MARGTMHAPKDPGQRRRRNAPTHDTITLTRDGETRGKPLHEATGRSDWEPLTLQWWETWRTAPQSQAFEATDWQRLALLAFTYDQCVRRPSAAALAEIRMNEERLGATVVDRMRARMRIEDEGDDAPVLKLADRREDLKRRLQGAE